jgi:hypothetical protein
MVTNAVAAVGMRTYPSAYYHWATQPFARLARDIETAHTGNSTFNVEHRAFVANAVLSAVAFLEASINEIFDDVADRHSGYVDPLTDDCKRLMAGLWDDRTEGRRFLDKCQLALLCSNSTAFDTGRPPYQDADLLNKLRNRLTHSGAVTRITGNENKLEEALKKKFPSSRLMMGSANPYFPDHCLGAGCAEWAVQSAVGFADEFFRRLKVIPNYQRDHNFPPP